MKLIDRILARFNYLKVIYPDEKPSYLFSLRKREVLRLAINATLYANLGSESLVNDELIADLTDQVYRRMNNLETLTLKEFIDKVHAPILASRMMTYCAGVGVTAKWEMDIKILAINLGVDVYQSGNAAHKKSPGFKDLEEIVDDLKRKLPLLDLGLHRLRNLRNALAHANFHLLRISASESQKKNVRENLKGNVWHGTFKDDGLSEPERLAELEDFERIKKVGPFGWFIDAANSTLFEKVVLEFRKSSEQLNALILLRAFSFGETSTYFERVCIKGESLLPSDIQAFQYCHKTHFDIEAVNRLFSDIGRMRKK